MSLTAGARLGPYEVLGLLGAGGMGEVYKARDTRLDRTVAIKVLSPQLADEPERRARFEREARTISALSHPHICALYDVGESGRSAYLVMEHLVGETLAQRLKKGALPLGQAIEVAAQITDALSAAHKQGVVHRDLKPANIILTKQGAKLLDFGLAKLAGHGERSALTADASAPTEEPLTGRGTILGTMPYMAPEQLEGKPADARTDLWALGAILYEMVTGARAFAGSSSVSLIGAIMHAEPPPLATRDPLTPPALDHVIRRCLAKDPDARWDSAHDVLNELTWLKETNTQAPIAAQASGRWRTPKWALFTVCVAVASAGLAAWATARLSSPSGPPVHLTIPLKTALVATAGQYAHLAISPDGQLIVFVEDGQLVRRPIADFKAIALDSTRGSRFPTFKPDGAAVAFYSGGRIKRTTLVGERTDVVTNASVEAGLDWGEDDQIYFASGLGTGGIWRVAASGGTPEAVTRLDDTAGDNAHTWPQLLPGAKALLFTVLGPSGGSDDSRVVVQELATGDRKVIAERAIGGRFVASGHVLYGRNDGSVYAVPFDPVRAIVLGTPTAVLTGVGTATWGGQVFATVSAGGTLVYLPPTERQDFITRIVDERGVQANTASTLDATIRTNLGPHAQGVRASPDGTRLTLTARGPGVCDIWIYDIRTADAERVTFDPAEDEYAIWSGNGSMLAYTSAHTATTRRIFMLDVVAGGAAPRLVRTWPRHSHVTSWSKDGRWMLIDDYTSTAAMDVFAIPVSGGEAIAVATTQATERGARFSPDGRWIAYADDSSGRSEVYVVSFPDLNNRRQISADGGVYPIWSPDGTALYYLQPGYLVAHEIAGGDQLSRGRATRPFPTTAAQFDVLPNGRFILSEPNTEPADAPLHVILNWFDELRAAMPH